MEKSKIFLVPLMALSFLASCGPTRYDVAITQINGLSISNTKATKGEFFVTKIAVDSSKTDEMLPDKLTSVKVGQQPCDYTYLPSNDYLSATILIDEALITDKINIELSLRLPWYLDNNYLNNLKDDDINKNGGVTQTVLINGQKHKVRLIGIDHDDLSTGNGKAHTTWEFENYICDSNGYSLATPWNWQDGEYSNTKNYFDSNLRKALDGQGKGEIAWYEKGSPTKSAFYVNPVIDMLPAKLKNVLKEVKKNVSIYESDAFVVESYNTKLFPLSYSEVVKTPPTGANNEGSTYFRYGGTTGDRDINRLKHQIKWHDGAINMYTKITDVDIGTATASNYAGFNASDEYYGGYCWLRSPHTNGSASSAWQLSVGGSFLSYSGYSYALAVAPAFCI